MTRKEIDQHFFDVHGLRGYERRDNSSYDKQYGNLVFVTIIRVVEFHGRNKMPTLHQIQFLKQDLRQCTFLIIDIKAPSSNLTHVLKLQGEILPAK